ncbi:MAG TPA: hypothetical protein VM123_12845 [archaeon]|nr:hypothetical protein [archaeon]
MLKYDFLPIKILTLAALCLALTSPLNAEWKVKYISSGNNCGLFFTSQESCLLGREGGAFTTFPRGSGNIYAYQVYNWGTSRVADLNGDGEPEDTICNTARGARHYPGRASLEFKDRIEALAKGGGNMFSEVQKIENSRIWTSTDPGDLAEWPPEFRTGRTEGGEPIIHGTETVVAFLQDCFHTSAACGASEELSFYFLNFAESNDMVYIHCFIRNMSEYIKYNFSENIRDYYANFPDGHTWDGWMLDWSYGNVRIGGIDYQQGWALNSELEAMSIFDRDGVNPNFSGYPAADIGIMLRPPGYNGESMEFTGYNTMGYSNPEFGFPRGIDLLNTADFKRNYRAGRGPYGPHPWLFEEVPSPWTGQPMYMYPGRLYPGDPYYDRGWIWGTRQAYIGNMWWSELHDFAPRDTTSFDFVRAWVYTKTPNYAFPLSITSELANPEPDEQMEPWTESLKAAKIVYEGGYIVPETPAPPLLTIVPGNQEVTITWSEVNVHTPDQYYYFLQQHPELDPDGVYREYDFEGYRLYRSFVGPSDSHSELIFQCSLTDQNIQFYYVDKQDTDAPRYRMQNGMRVWYALVPYDANYDPSIGEVFSLPDPASGKVWNQPGPAGLFNVQARSNASNFRPAKMEMGDYTFVPHSPGLTITEGKTYELKGDGTGKLTEQPLYMAPTVKDIRFIPVIQEKLNTEKTISVVCSEVSFWLECDPLAWGAAIFQIADGANKGMQSVPIMADRRASEDLALVSMNGPASAEGVDYAVEMTYEGLLKPTRVGKGYLLAQVDQGSYSGGDVYVPIGGCSDRQVGGSPTFVAFARTAVLQVTWKDAGNGNLTVEVEDKMRGETIPYGEYIDDFGWGFITLELYGGTNIGEGFDPWVPDFYGYIAYNVPRSERTVKFAQTIPADNTEQFALFADGIAWKIASSENHKAPDGITMPAPGTVWTMYACYGKWNDDKTVFTQYAEIPWLGDKWELKVKPMSMNAEDIDLAKIRVVPNPYMASSALDLSPDNRRIEFVNLPDRCTIRIYTLSGNLVNVLNHIGANRQGWGNYQDWDRLDADNNPRVLTGYDNHGGTEPWNLRNRFGQTVASGLYFFHVTDSRGEAYTGKFYVIN